MKLPMLLLFLLLLAIDVAGAKIDTLVPVLQPRRRLSLSFSVHVFVPLSLSVSLSLCLSLCLCLSLAVGSMQSARLKCRLNGSRLHGFDVRLSPVSLRPSVHLSVCLSEPIKYATCKRFGPCPFADLARPAKLGNCVQLLTDKAKCSTRSLDCSGLDAATAAAAALPAGGEGELCERGARGGGTLLCR